MPQDDGQREGYIIKPSKKQPKLTSVWYSFLYLGHQYRLGGTLAENWGIPVGRDWQCHGCRNRGTVVCEEAPKQLRWIGQHRAPG